MKHKTNLTVAENVNRVLTDIAKRMGGGSVQIGFLEGATYPDGTPVAAVAYWDEFGHGGHFPAPPRSFFRTMITKDSPTWPGMMAKLVKENNYDGLKVLKLMGEHIDGELKKSIHDTNTPELSKTTLRLRSKFWGNPQDITITDVLKAQRDVAKGRKNLAMASGTQAKPLVWTGHMLASTGYQINRGPAMSLNVKSGEYEERS